jgi:RimJ/RimL family protein N-acetyltransferase
MIRVSEKKKILIGSKRIYMRVLSKEDVTDRYVNGLNDPEVNKFLVNVRLNKQTKKKVKEFVACNLRSSHDILLGVFLKDEDILIGTVRVGDISYFHRLCTIGVCFFDRKYWGKGYASEAIKEASVYLFKKLKLHYIEAGVYEDNQASMKLFERAGFKAQARYEDKYRYEHDFKPVAIWGLVNPDFKIERAK